MTFLYKNISTTDRFSGYPMNACAGGRNSKTEPHASLEPLMTLRSRPDASVNFQDHREDPRDERMEEVTMAGEFPVRGKEGLDTKKVGKRPPTEGGSVGSMKSKTKAGTYNSIKAQTEKEMHARDDFTGRGHRGCRIAHTGKEERRQSAGRWGAAGKKHLNSGELQG